MRLSDLFTATLGCLALSACASSRLPVGNNVILAQPKTPATHGDTPVVIRAFAFNADTPGNRGDELADARCNVTSQHFSASLRTPGSLTAPLYGMGTPTLAVTCSKPGHGSGTTVVRAFNKTQNDMLSAGANAGIVGFLIMGVAVAASDAKGHQYGYPPELEVVLRPQ